MCVCVCGRPGSEHIEQINTWEIKGMKDEYRRNLDKSRIWTLHEVIFSTKKTIFSLVCSRDFFKKSVNRSHLITSNGMNKFQNMLHGYNSMIYCFINILLHFPISSLEIFAYFHSCQVFLDVCAIVFCLCNSFDVVGGHLPSTFMTSSTTHRW